MNLFNLSEADTIASLEKQLAELKEQLAAVNARLEKTMPCYARKKTLRTLLEQETDEATRACIERTLEGLEMHEKLIIALSDEGKPNVI